MQSECGIEAGEVDAWITFFLTSDDRRILVFSDGLLISGGKTYLYMDRFPRSNQMRTMMQ
jgi:hypothetical protein